MGSIVGASGRTPMMGERQLAPTCKARKSDGRGNPPGCPISGGSASRPYLPQRINQSIIGLTPNTKSLLPSLYKREELPSMKKGVGEIWGGMSGQLWTP